MDYDIVIIGAGPAGSTLVRLLDKKYKVLLVDKRNMKDSATFKYNKCCGGLLAPDAQKALAHQGLGIPKEIIVGPQMFSVKTEDFDNMLTKYYQRHYINVDRERFDRWLLSLAAGDVDVMFETHFRGYLHHDEYYEIDLLQDNKYIKVKTKMLVGADGAVSKIRRSTFPFKKQAKQYVSIQKWFSASSDFPYYVSIFDKEITDFYSWMIQKDEHLIVGAALEASSQAKKKFDLLIDKLKASGYMLEDLEKTEGTWLLRPTFINQVHLYKDHVALIGEAAGFISPSSAEGISYALKSGAMLAMALNQSFENYGKIYQKKAKKLKLIIWLKHIKSIFMYNRITRKIIMKLGILSMDIQ